MEVRIKIVLNTDDKWGIAQIYMSLSQGLTKVYKMKRLSEAKRAALHRPKHKISIHLGGSRLLAITRHEVPEVTYSDCI